MAKTIRSRKGVNSQVKTYHILDDENSHEYDINVVENGRKTSFDLYYSNNGVWSSSTREKLSISVLDNGNGLKVVSKEKKGSENYDYWERLRLLLNFIQNYGRKIPIYTAHQNETAIKI
jgi:hypothetical protein